MLSKSIDSCLNQNYPYLEIIIVNDGSTNLDTEETLKNYKHKFSPKITVYKIENSGASLARKYGLERCNTDFIFFLDADDYIEENALGKLVKLQAQENSDVVVGQSNIVSDRGILGIKKFKFIEGDHSIIKSFLTGNLPITFWPNLYKRELFQDVTFYDFPITEDLVVNTQIFTKSNIKIALLDDVVYNYYRHSNSLTKSISQEKTNLGYAAYCKSLEIINERIDVSNLENEICVSKLNTLYALLILNSNLCKVLIKDIKKYRPEVIKSAIGKFTFFKKTLFSIVINQPFTLPFVLVALKSAKKIKSN